MRMGATEKQIITQSRLESLGTVSCSHAEFNFERDVLLKQLFETASKIRQEAKKLGEAHWAESSYIETSLSHNY
jgi:hypothetical protein